MTNKEKIETANIAVSKIKDYIEIKKIQDKIVDATALNNLIDTTNNLINDAQKYIDKLK